MRSLFPLLLLATAAACTPGALPAPKAASAAPTYDATPKAPLAWVDFDAKTFARAKAERKFVILDGSAEWCHWCHVMEAVTYHDPDVRKVLDLHFITAKVDVDARPDVEERYAEYGWPATVIFSPDAEELGKYRGFIDPSQFVTILNDVVAAGDGASAARPLDEPPIPDAPLATEQLAWIGRMTALLLDDRWDEEQGSWGHGQKVPLFHENAWALSHARAGDPVAKKRALFTLDQQLAILDPVFGGIYQYSTDGDWKHPHFEKLLYYNVGALENYAEAAQFTREKRYADAARGIKGYVDRFLSGPSGGFYATQDADLNAHEQGKAFLTGHEYYAKDEAGRLALGLPRVDTHEYARENGLAVAAYCAYARAMNDPSAVDRATRAADRVLATHTRKVGLLAHDAEPDAHLAHLADNAAFAWGLLALLEQGQKERLAQAITLVDGILDVMEDRRGGGFFAHTVDPDAVGIFTLRRKPFEDNVMMLRVLAKLVRAVPEKAVRYQRAIDRTLRALATPDKIVERGRFLGDFLLALEETKAARRLPPQP